MKYKVALFLLTITLMVSCVDKNEMNKIKPVESKDSCITFTVTDTIFAQNP